MKNCKVKHPIKKKKKKTPCKNHLPLYTPNTKNTKKVRPENRQKGQGKKRERLERKSHQRIVIKHRLHLVMANAAHVITSLPLPVASHADASSRGRREVVKIVDFAGAYRKAATSGAAAARRRFRGGGWRESA